jgi:hypothetical protein
VYNNVFLYTFLLVPSPMDFAVSSVCSLFCISFCIDVSLNYVVRSSFSWVLFLHLCVNIFWELFAPSSVVHEGYYR